MLDLDDPRWSSLTHAYGAADDIPPLLAMLADLPTHDGDSDPWETLWSSLAHQGDVYPASFAAVPHVIRALATAPAAADGVYFQFPAWVEICRARKDVVVPPELAPAYHAALAQLPALVAAAAAREWTPDFAACAISALAAAKGRYAMAEAVLEMASDGDAERMLAAFFDAE